MSCVCCASVVCNVCLCGVCIVNGLLDVVCVFVWRVVLYVCGVDGVCWVFR